MKMKKFLITITLVCTFALSLCACSGCNKQIFDFQYEFDQAWVYMGGKWQLYELSKWTDYEDGEQLQLTLKDGRVILVHAQNCILIDN